MSTYNIYSDKKPRTSIVSWAMPDRNEHEMATICLPDEERSDCGNAQTDLSLRSALLICRVLLCFGSVLPRIVNRRSVWSLQIPTFVIDYLVTFGRYLKPVFIRSKCFLNMGGCPGWSESLMGAHVILLVLSRCGSFVFCTKQIRVIVISSCRSVRFNTFTPNGLFHSFKLD